MPDQAIPQLAIQEVLPENLTRGQSSRGPVSWLEAPPDRWGGLADVGVISPLWFDPSRIVLTSDNSHSYSRPAGSLSPRRIDHLLKRAAHAVLDSGMLRQLAARHCLPGNGNDWSDPLPPHIAQLLRHLHARKLAGQRSAITPLPSGAMVADWPLDRVYHADLRAEPVMAKPLDAEQFLAAMIRHGHWAQEAPLKDPLAAAAQRSLYTLAVQLGLRPGTYEVRITIL
jgi:hypothetical protein